jgi:hypothetical protein
MVLFTKRDRRDSSMKHRSRLPLLVSVLLVLALTACGSSDSWDNWRDGTHLAAGPNGWAVLTDDGRVATVSLDGEASWLEGWTDIVAVYADGDGFDGITSDGDFLTTSAAPESQQQRQEALGSATASGGVWGAGIEATAENASAILDLSDIRWAYCNYPQACLAILGDGTVQIRDSSVFQEAQAQAESWTNLSQILPIGNGVVGLTEDGHVVATSSCPQQVLDVVESWEDVTTITVGSELFALRSDGTVYTSAEADLSGKVGSWNEGDVADWTDIVQIAAGRCHTLGLRSDGTVVATGANDHGQLDVSEWENVAAIATSDTYTVGITQDGKFLLAGADVDMDTIDLQDIQ